jgi:hypothetical protein
MAMMGNWGVGEEGVEGQWMHEGTEDQVMLRCAHPRCHGPGDRRAEKPNFRPELAFPLAQNDAASTPHNLATAEYRDLIWGGHLHKGSATL